jgi:hypothetical protein
MTSASAMLREARALAPVFGTAVSTEPATIEVVDFVTGNLANFARACSPKGVVLEIVRRGEGEPYAAFLARAKSLAGGLGAPRLVVGGIHPAFDADAVCDAAEAPQGVILLPDGGGLHPGQIRATRIILNHPRAVLRAGRRFGKSTLLIALAADEAIRGRPVGYFTPLYKTAVPVFDALALMLAPLCRLTTPRPRNQAFDRRDHQHLVVRDVDPYRQRS